MTETVELVDGQIYRWRWSDPAKDADRAPYRSYHCKSQIAEVRNGLLVDTFWFGGGSEYALSLDQVELTFLCDQSWSKIPSYEVPYYDHADIADTRHSNLPSAPIYLRPGAKRSAVAILAEIERREEKARSDIRDAEYRLKRASEERAKLDAGLLDEVSL